MKEQIGKVTMDYTFYSGNDEYSDGDIEQEMLDMVKEDADWNKILKKEKRWPILYHMSSIRENIIEWYPFEKDARVLEVGAGCGAVTGALCRAARSVTCVDLSKRRSLINALRHRQYSNLNIVVGNFNDIELNQEFDYITLIGVFEYAAYYTATENPFPDFLRNVGKMLKPGGKILMAIENKYGLKYWGGVREDHTGKYFEGLEGYPSGDSHVRTFSKDKLISIIEEAGFSKMVFYYPFPDYKFPRQIFSDDYLPKEEDLVCTLNTYDNSRVKLFDETAVYQGLIEEGKFDFFANSFFVEIGKE